MTIIVFSPQILFYVDLSMVELQNFQEDDKNEKTRRRAQELYRPMLSDIDTKESQKQ